MIPLLTLAALLPLLAHSLPLLPRQQNSTTTGTGSWPTIPLNANFLYDLDNVGTDVSSITSKHGVNVEADVLLVDGSALKNGMAETYHSKGRLVIGYFSAGVVEPRRDDQSMIPPECFCGPDNTWDASAKTCSSQENYMASWDNYWLDISSESCLPYIKEMVVGRLEKFKEYGVDGVDPDNVDAFQNKDTHTFDITEEDQYNYLVWLADTAHSMGLAIDLKNAGSLTRTYPDLVDKFDFSVVESCGDSCSTYDAFPAAKKPQLRVEYNTRLSSCPTDLPEGVTYAQYDINTINSDNINLYCGERSGETLGGATTGSVGATGEGEEEVEAGDGTGVEESGSVAVPSATVEGEEAVPTMASPTDVTGGEMQAGTGSAVTPVETGSSSGTTAPETTEEDASEIEETEDIQAPVEPEASEGTEDAEVEPIASDVPAGSGGDANTVGLTAAPVATDDVASSSASRTRTRTWRYGNAGWQRHAFPAEATIEV